MKVYITSCETGPEAWRHQEHALRVLWERSDRQHTIVESPESADIILTGNLREEHSYRSLRRHPIINRFPGKCFAINETDEPFPLLQGIYTSAHKKLRFKSRCRTGAYNLYHPDFKNPFAESHDGRSFDRPKRYICSFIGRNCHPVRAQIFRRKMTREDILIADTSSFNLFTHNNEGKREQQRKFIEIVEQSKFALCPRGNGAASIRLFEAMKMGVAPIIVADDWILPQGPAWEEFALFVKEDEVDSIEKVLIKNEPKYKELGASAALAYTKFFSDEVYFNFIINQCVDITKKRILPEVIYWSLRNIIVTKQRLEIRVRRLFCRR